MLNNAVNYGMRITMEIHAGTIGITTSFIPTSIDEGSNNIIIYSGDDIYIIDTTDISFDDVENKYTTKNDHCIVNISLE